MRRSGVPLTVCVFSFLLGACGGGRAQAVRAEDAPDAAAPISVEVVQTRSGAVPLTERLTGTVRASGEVAIYPETSGPVVEVLAQNGDAVRKGQPLVRIRASGSRAQLEQSQSSLAAARAELGRAEARLTELERQLSRFHVLIERGLLSRSELDTQQGQVDTARAEVARAKAEVAVAQATVTERSETQAQTVVRAPISGRIGQRNVEVGMLVNPQMPLFVIGRLENMRVEVPVSQQILAHVKENQRVEIRVDGNAGEPIEAQVSRISPFLQAGSFSAEVEIDVPNGAGRLVPGMFVLADIFYGQSEEATLVPTSALYEHPATGEQGVFITAVDPAAVQASRLDGADGGLSKQAVEIPFRPIDVIAEGPQTAAVSGVQPGEWVVVVGQHLLSTQGERAAPQARIRVVDWERILALQGLQREDLLRQFMDKQQRLAAGL